MSLRHDVVRKLRSLFLKHDKHEDKIIRKIRKYGGVSDDDLQAHHVLEEEILYAMAAATPDEIAAAELG